MKKSMFKNYKFITVLVLFISICGLVWIATDGRNLTRNLTNMIFVIEPNESSQDKIVDFNDAGVQVNKLITADKSKLAQMSIITQSPIKMPVKKVTAEDLFLRFAPKSSFECKDDQLCVECSGDECSKCDKNFNPSTTFKQWLQVLKNKSLTGKYLFHDDEYMYPWEKDYLSQPPLTDLKKLPNLSLSKITPLSVHASTGSRNTSILNFVGFETGEGNRDIKSFVKQEGKGVVVTCQENDVVTFRVDLFDNNGHPRNMGGDEVRAWLKRKEAPHQTVAGNVKDYGNGSYVVNVMPVWTGTAKLSVAVAYPREYLRVAIYHSKIGSHRYNFGKFKKGDIEEVTICHSMPNIPGRSCLCNFTALNTEPFFCGRPLNKKLSCKDWIEVHPASQPPFKRFTPAERIMAGQMAREVDKAVIRQDIKIISEKPNIPQTIQPLCSKIKIQATWNVPAPRGYWSDGNKWTNIWCKEPEMPQKSVQSCLRNAHILCIGDSNMLRIMAQLCSITKCRFTTKWDWPANLEAEVNNYGTLIHFKPHPHPLYLHNRWNSLHLNGGFSKMFDSIPSTGRHFVFIHYYLHLSKSHLSALHIRLNNLKVKIKELLQRNNKTIIGFRGPHVSSVEFIVNHMNAGDVLGSFMLRLIQDAFSDLKSNVIFLDGWEMSIGIKNGYFHPPDKLPLHLVKHLLAFACP